MNKYKFVEIINRLKESTQLQEDINQLIRKSKDYRESMNASSLMISHEDIVIELLQEMMDDAFDYITWWIYETDYGRRETMTKIYDKNDKIIADIKTAEDLYDYLKNERN